MLRRFRSGLYFKATDFFLALYEQILTGLWSILLLTPIENFALYLHSGSEPEVSDLFIRFLIYVNIFFFISSALLPYIRKVRLREQISMFVHTKKLTKKEKQTLNIIANSNIMCQSLFSKNGFLHFVSSSIINVSLMALYFSIDQVVDLAAGRSDGNYISIAIFFVISIVFYFISKIIDFLQPVDFSKSNTNSKFGKFGKLAQVKVNSNEQCKTVVTSIIRLVSKDNMESNLEEKILDDAFESIKSIIKMSGGSSINPRRGNNNFSSKRKKK